MRGDVPAAFAGLRAQYDAGADPAVILSDLAAFSHVVTRLKLIPEAAKDPALTEVERIRGTDFAQKLSVRTLSRAWQILLKGIPEVQASNRPVAAAEMVLVRLAYAADLPTPDEALRALKDGAPAPSGRSVRSAPSRPSGPADFRQHGAGHLAGSAAAAPATAPDAAQPPCACAASRTWWRWPASSARSCSRRALERDVRLVRFEEGRIEFSLAEGGSRTIANDLARALQHWTGDAGSWRSPRKPARRPCTSRQQPPSASARRAPPTIRSSRRCCRSFPGARSST